VNPYPGTLGTNDQKDKLIKMIITEDWDPSLRSGWHDNQMVIGEDVAIRRWTADSILLIGVANRHFFPFYNPAIVSSRATARDLQLLKQYVHKTILQSAICKYYVICELWKIVISSTSDGYPEAVGLIYVNVGLRPTFKPPQRFSSPVAGEINIYSYLVKWNNFCNKQNKTWTDAKNHSPAPAAL
jgi:hypothetical protein